MAQKYAGAVSFAMFFNFSSPEPQAHKVSLQYSKAPASSSVVHTLEQKYLQDQFASFSQILSVASSGKRKGCVRFWGRLGQNWLSWQQKAGVTAFSKSPLIGSLSNLQVTRTGIKSPMSLNLGWIGYFPWEFHLTLNEENGVSIFSQSLWIQLSSNLQVTRTGIKSRRSSNSGRIWPVVLDLRALEWWKQWCLQLFSVTFDLLFVKLAGNEKRHKSSNKFKFELDRIIHFGVITFERGNCFP